MRQSIKILTVFWVVACCSSFVPANDNLFLHAIKNDDINLISQLIRTEVNINQADQTGKTALMVAAKAGNPQLVKKLLDNGALADIKNNNGGSAIMFACIKGDMETIRLLIEKEVDVNARGSNGWGALMIASAKGHTEVVKLLLQHNVDVNTVDVYEWTPLHRASYENREQIVELLLNVPAIKVNAQDDQGATALHHAAVKGNINISKRLIEKGADIHQTDLIGRTAQHYAEKNGYMALAAMLEEASS